MSIIHKNLQTFNCLRCSIIVLIAKNMMIEYNKILDLTQSIDSDTCDLYLGCGASNNARSDSLH